MYGQMWCSFSLMAVLGLVGAGLAGAADPDLVGWWEFDAASGGVVKDSSDNGNDGTLQGGASIVDDAERGKVLRVNGIDGYASIPNSADFDITDVTLMFWMKLASDFGAESASSMAPVGKAPDEDHTMQFTLIGKDNSQNPKGAMYMKVEGPAYGYVYTPEKSWAGNTWYHVTGVYDHTTAKASLYINGASVGTTALQGGSDFRFDALDVPLEIGRLLIDKAGGTVKYFDGCIDDVRLYRRALTAADIQDAMQGVLPVMARRPSPVDKAVDVLRDIILTWTPGEEAVQHDVFLGTDLDSLRNATVASNTYMGRQSEARYAPGRLDLGQTYYWRVDEIKDGHPDSPWIGQVWSFTVEPLAIPLAGRFITATASSLHNADMGPQKTVDGSGLDATGLHGTADTTMWLSNATAAGPVWIQYEFDRVYKLHEMWVWNSNQSVETTIGFGAKDVTIEYSTDMSTWATLGTSHQFARAPGLAGYAHETTIAFDGVAAKYVRLTIHSNWGVFPQFGLSEVQFYQIPAFARVPQPAAAATDIGPEAVLSWRAGRDAVSHQLYLSTDRQAVVDGTAPMVTTVETSYAPASLELGSTCYWKVVEVNDAATPAAWESDVWSFSVTSYLAIDEFESYNDEEDQGTRIYETWIDGVTNGTGSMVGYWDPPFAEQKIVHGGKQSMPLTYDNTSAARSEVERAWQTPQDWTLGGAQTLVLFFCGDPANTGGQLYIKVNGVKIPYDGDPQDINRPWWSQWNIDLTAAGVTKQKSITSFRIGVEDSGSSGTLYLDDIRLYRSTPASPEVVSWLEAESATSITEPMKVWSDMADAAGGRYIAAAKGNVSGDYPPATGVAKYTLTVAGGIYRIMGRVIAPAGSSDSFWVRIPGALIDKKTDVSGWLHWSMERGSAWHWTAVNSYDADSATVLFRLPAGTYTLEVAYREEGALLDALVVLEEPPAAQADVVLYEETFPNGQGSYKPMAWIGWEGYVGANATQVTTVEPGDYKDDNIIVDAEDNKAFHLKGNVAFMFTEEPGVLSQFEVGAFSAEIQKKDTPLRFAVRIDKNNTPGDTSDDAWFVTHAGYTQASQTTVTVAFTTAASAWRDLILKPGVELSMAADARVQDLPAGDLTAYGIYGEANGQLRIFNYKVLSEIP